MCPFFNRQVREIVCDLTFKNISSGEAKKLSDIRQAFPFAWFGKPFAINGIKLGGVGDPCFQIDSHALQYWGEIVWN